MIVLSTGAATPTQDEGEGAYQPDNVYMPDLMDGFLLNQGMLFKSHMSNKYIIANSDKFIVCNISVPAL